MKYSNTVEIAGDSKDVVRVDFACFADGVKTREDVGFFTSKEWADVECLADELLNLSFNPACAADDEEDFEGFYADFSYDVDSAAETFNNEMIIKHISLINEVYDVDDMIDFDVEGETISEHVSTLESRDCNDSNIVINSLNCYRGLETDVFDRCCELWSESKHLVVRV